jgi:hypothetical protein
MSGTGRLSAGLPGLGATLRALILMSLVMAVWTAPASAGSWTAFNLRDDQIGGDMFAVACPSTSLCVAGGSDSLIATSTNPARGSSAWATFHPDKEEHEGAESKPPGVFFPGAAVRGIACPSTMLCVGDSFDGRIFSSTNPAGGASAWKVIPLGGEKEPHVHMTGISCPSVHLCVAVAYGSKVITSSDPTGEASAWSVSELATPVDLRGISCSAVSFCAAVDNAGQIVTSSNPTGGAGAWSLVGAPGGEGSLNGISCPSLALCVTGNAGRIITSTNPGGGLAAWSAVAAGSGLPVKGVSCPTTSACAAVDNNSDAITSTNPLGGSVVWSSVNVIPVPGPKGETPLGGVQNGAFGISCPTTTLCVAVGASEHVIVSTDPFATDVAPATGRKSKRLRVAITGHPNQRVNPRKGGVRVGFRFRLTSGGLARFRCKLAGGSQARGRRHLRRLRFAACTSPVHYRLGKGKYVFRVRAVSVSRRKSPPASFHFRVGRVVERKPVGSCRRETAQGFPLRPCVNAREAFALQAGS